MVSPPDAGGRAPHVSVVMSVFNGEQFLADSIDSVLAQTYRDFEFLIVDDGSTDATPAMLDEAAARDDRIQLISNSSNLGIPAAVNRAMSVARGELIARMDADDVVPPHWLQAQVAFLDTHPAVSVVGARYEEFTTSVDVRTPGRIPTGGLRGGNPPFPQSSMVGRRPAFDRAGPYDEQFGVAEEHDLFLRMAHAGCEFACNSEVLLYRRLHDSNVSLRSRRLQLQQNLKINMRGIRHYGLRLSPAGWLHLVRTAAFWLYLRLKADRIVPEHALRRVFRRPSGRG